MSGRSLNGLDILSSEDGWCDPNTKMNGLSSSCLTVTKMKGHNDIVKNISIKTDSKNRSILMKDRWIWLMNVATTIFTSGRYF